MAGATNGRPARARPVNPSHSEDSVAETALSKKNSDGKKWKSNKYLQLAVFRIRQNCLSVEMLLLSLSSRLTFLH